MRGEKHSRCKARRKQEAMLEALTKTFSSKCAKFDSAYILGNSETLCVKLFAQIAHLTKVAAAAFLPGISTVQKETRTHAIHLCKSQVVVRMPVYYPLAGLLKIN